MKVIYQNGETYVIRFDRGEEVLGELQKFCAAQNIRAGTFWGIGAAEGITLAEYNLAKKEYKTVDVSEMLEIGSFTGNIAVAEGKVMLHAHGVFSTLEKTHAGHVMKLTVGVTCEVTLTILPGEIRREYSEDIGLKLLA